MRILLAITTLALAALLWATLSIAYHIRLARRRRREQQQEVPPDMHRHL